MNYGEIDEGRRRGRARRRATESIVADPGTGGEEEYDEDTGEDPADGGASFRAPPPPPPDPEAVDRTSGHGTGLQPLVGLRSND